MRKEIAAVVFFLKRLVKKAEKLESHKVELFVERLAVALQEKFKGHWYPENPSKGQAYRCIRVNRFHRQDPELLRACWESGVQYSDLGLPRELTLWVDPGEVCCTENKILASQWPLSLTTTQVLPPMRRAHALPPLLSPTTAVLTRYCKLHFIFLSYLIP
uniref:B-cell translocation gene 3 n=1 Tax=Lates calcarifer TaxID=8187 RepID=A0A4W6EAS7_LATCA